jgi:AsmA protein
MSVDSDRLAGALSLQLTGSGRGSTRTALLKDLVGDFSLGMTDGAYRGMDIVHEFQSARALFRREPQPAAPASRETPIRALSLSGQVRDGVLGSDRLVAEIPYMQLSGKGGLDLVALTVDYRLNAEVLAEGADDGKLGDLAGSIIPFTIRGPVMAPRVRIDLKDMVTTTVRQRAEDRLRSELLQRFGGRPETAPAAGEADAPTASQSEETPQQADDVSGKERAASPEELLKRGLRDLLKR